MSLEMGYQIKYFPDEFRVEEHRTVSDSVPYWGIYNRAGVLVGQSLDENWAKIICFSCELTSAYLMGDNSKVTAIMTVISKLRRDG